MAKKKPNVPQHLHICIDRVLPLSLQMEASQRAIAENPSNLAFLGSHGPMRAAASPMAMALLTSRKWKNGRKLRVRFMGGSAFVQARVEKYAREWTKYANIEFDFNNDLDAEIRIAFEPDGSWSYLGTDALTIAPGKATMNYGWFANSTPEEEFSRTTLHEFGHALGCIHEHQHPLAGIPWDKPKVYAYYAQPPNSWSAADVDSNLFQKYSVNQTQHSEFDEKSIMLYAIPDELTLGSYEVGWNTTLSKTDKDWIAAAYPKSKPTAVPTLVPGKPQEASIGKYGEEDLFELVVTAKGNYVIETTGKTDVVVRLMGPDNPTQVVAEDDDSGESHNARIARNLIPGTYQVRVRHYRPKGTGKYTLLARKV